MSFSLQLPIPSKIIDLIKTLQDHGFQAVCVGGCIRDLLLGKTPTDYDIATNAEPSEVCKFFSSAKATFAKFGTVVVPSEDPILKPIEITTFRSEAKYIKGRWPSEIKFTDKLEEDLARRDFTINAMTYDPVNKKLTDLFGGEEDLRRHLIRAVGDPNKRFQEDGLRGVRACRLAATLNYGIEERTFAAIEANLEVAAQVSKERFRDELVRLLEEAEKPSTGIELMRKTGLLTIFLPELLEGYGIWQPFGHKFDVYLHTLVTVDKASPDLRLAAFFHDIGKPRAKSTQFAEKHIKRLEEKGIEVPPYHFQGHAEISEKMTREILQRLHFPKKVIKETALLVRYHMFSYQSAWSDKAVRRFIQKVGGKKQAENLLRLRIAEVKSDEDGVDLAGIEELKRRIEKVTQMESAFKVTDLAIDGNDLIMLGVPQGSKIGKVLNELLDKVIEDPTINNSKKLLELAKEYSESNIKS